MSSEVFDLKHTSWNYINEGNVHIVLLLEGTDCVLRLIKEDQKYLNIRHIKNSVEFVNFIMLPMFYDSNNVGSEKLVQINNQEIKELSEQLLKWRPPNRISKMLLSQYAIIAPNLAIVSSQCDINYCIEIKPKEGYLSPNLQRYGKCYYCMKQYLKMEENQINSISNYCPLDLYSGNKGRMFKAISNLINNPQNNFKLFKNGSICFNENSTLPNLKLILEEICAFNGSVSLFIEFIIQVLLVNDTTHTIEAYDGENTIAFEEFNCKNKTEVCNTLSELHSDCILYKMLDLQKLGVNFNPKYDNEIYEKDNQYAYVESLLNILKEKNINMYKKSDRDAFLQRCDAVHLAMLSAIARDCSIMISFSYKFISGENVRKIKINQQEIYYKICVTDLEPKPLTTLLKRSKNEDKLIKIYTGLKP